MAIISSRNEAARLVAFRRYESLDLEGDAVIDGITRLAAEVMRVPMVALGLAGQDSIALVSRFGLDIEKVDRLDGLFDLSINDLQLHCLANAAECPETKSHPLVGGEPAVRFFASAPLITRDNYVVGVLCVMDRAEREPTDDDRMCLTQLAAVHMQQLDLRLKASRVEKLEHDHRLLGEQLQKVNKALAESEERFRDLFDEAPIAYVHEGVDTRFIRANRVAIRTLGIKPEEAVGFVGKSLAPDNPEAQHLMEDALNHIGTGSEARGLLMELARKDTGAPIWIEWWSKPAPDGSYTRTMFLDITEKVLLTREKLKLEAQNIYLQEEILSTHFDDIVGDNDQMKQIFADVDQVAPTTATVLILGETGTGKEMIARAVHNASKRADMPLIKVNCSTLPASLIESELFGHTKGAFTGASEKRAGRFLLADGGSIFLDEIGDLPIELQAKLLRVLQEGEFEPLGSSQTTNVDVRVIAATNRDLFEAMQKGEFREDLYFRLAVFPITLPPLKDRLDDLPKLASLFAKKFTEKLGREPVALSLEEVDRLSSYSWPGNVRELQNVIERALITSRDGSLELNRALPESAYIGKQKSGSSATQRIQTVIELQQLELDNILLALDASGWRVSGGGGAAELLGMNPTTLSSRMKALKIRRPG